MRIELSRRKILFAALITAILLLGFFLRLRAATTLPQEYDEGVYIGIAHDFLGFVRNFDLRGLIAYNNIGGHPLFGKVMFSLGILVRDSLLSARLVSVVLGLLTVLLIAYRTPVGGFFLATELLTVKYSSMAYLDAGAVFFAVLSLFLYEKWKKNTKWFYLSAIAGGLALGTKYTTIWVPEVILILILVDNSKNWKQAVKKIFIWAGIAAVVFMAVNPPFWTDFPAKLWQSFTFHQEFAGITTQQKVFHFWDHLSLMWSSWPVSVHPGVFVIDIEKIILVSGFLGFPLLLYRKRWMESLWFTFSLTFLFAWPVKWPHYALIFTPVLAISGGFLVEELARTGFRSTNIYLKKFKARLLG